MRATYPRFSPATKGVHLRRRPNEKAQCDLLSPALIPFPAPTLVTRHDRGLGGRLFQGDCRWWLDRFPAESVDCIVADPPYFLSNGGLTLAAGGSTVCDKGSWDRSAGALNDWAFHLSWIAACRRVLKPAGTLWISGTSHSIYQCGLTLQQFGFRLLNEVIWFKPNAVPNLSCRVLTASHETLLWARKDPKSRHVFNYRALKDGDWAGDNLKRPGKQMRSVWSIPPAGSSEKRHGRHPTQKPLALLTRMLLASTRPGDLVLDPFCGSGTSGVAALQLGRKFIGIEREAVFLKLAARRLAECP